MVSDVARRRAHMPPGTGAILNAQTFATSHRRLAELLEPGLRVLDVGCGTGAITRGIAEAIGPEGRVVGIGVNPELIREARRAHGTVPALSFEAGDVQKLDGAVTEAERAMAEREHRTWIADAAESQTLYLLAVEAVRPSRAEDPDVAYVGARTRPWPRRRGSRGAGLATA
ncbi:MAG: methyltransferase domain-containing protein [Candidatus Rokuibacteriota bacterium]